MPSTLIKLTQMVDLAVGSPEPGTMNLNILHSLLHVLIQQMQIENTQVEFQGPDSERMQSFLSTSSPYPSLKLSEYVLYVDSKDKVVGTSKDGQPRDANEAEKPVGAVDGTDGGEKQKVDSKKSGLLPVSGRGKKRSLDGEHKVVLVQPFDSETEIAADGQKEKTKKTTHSIRPGTPLHKVAPKQSTPAVGLRALERTVSQLQADVAAMTQYNLPTNQELFDTVRGSAGAEVKPLNDMWETLKLAKRLDGAESGINKLTSMVEDIAREMGNVVVSSPSTAFAAGSVGKLTKRGSDEHADRITGIEKRLWDVEHRLGQTERRVSGASAGSPGMAGAPSSIMEASSGGGSRPAMEPTPSQGGSMPVSASNYGGGMSTEEGLQPVREELTRLQQEVEMLKETTKKAIAIGEAVPLDSLLRGMQQIEDMRRKLEDISGPDGVGALAVGEKKSKLGELQAQVQASNQQLTGIDATFTNQMEAFQHQMAEMEREMGTILERLNAGLPAAGDSGSNQDFGGFSELYGKIQNLQNDMDVIGNTATRLMDERDERQMHIDALLEQIEVLKTVKADKEDLEDALADKADQNIVNRKVSHDQFDAACDDLSRGLEEALAKLTNQETLWSQALDDIQREIENKLDKIEISPLKDFVNNKLRLLQERLKALAALRKETEAAGTKHRLLRNVNCLSCDKSVVQRLDDEGQSVPTEALPPHRSMKPYLTYELDAVRKQQRRLPGGGRNMNHFETAVHEQKGKCKDKEHIMAKSIDHLCNRYCGGSHTLTTPHQRVTRMGHFLTQWGPEAIQLDPSVRGTDGHSYKGQASKASGSVTGSIQRTPRGSVTKPGTSVEVLKSPRVSSTTKPGTPPKSPSKGPTPPRTPPKEGSLKGTPPKSPKGTPPKSPKGTPPKSPKVTPPGTPPKAPAGDEVPVEGEAPVEAGETATLTAAPPGDEVPSDEVPAGEGDAPAEAAPTDEAPADNVSAGEALAEEAPAEEAPAAEPAAEEPAPEEAPADAVEPPAEE